MPNAAICIHLLEPSTIAFCQHSNPLLDQFEFSKPLGLWVRQLCQHTRIDLGLAIRSVFLGPPIVLINQTALDVWVAVGVEVDGLLFDEEFTSLIAQRLVVPFGIKVL